MEDKKELEKTEEKTEEKIEEKNDGENNDVIDATKVVDMIKEKDDEIEQLRKDIAELKKSNANLLVRVNSGTTHTDKTFEENLMSLVGQPTERK